jgi:hypothetical protein
MGRGSGTTQKGVSKPKAEHTLSAGGEIAVFGDEEFSNVCLFSLELKIKYTAGTIHQATRGDTVTLARVASGEIGVFVNNRHFSSYAGEHKDRLLVCMAKGYVYSGQVQNVGANTLRVILEGGVLGHEAA